MIIQNFKALINYRKIFFIVTCFYTFIIVLLTVNHFRVEKNIIRYKNDINQLEMIKSALNVYKLNIGNYPETLSELDFFLKSSGYISNFTKYNLEKYKYKKITDKQYELFSESISLHGEYAKKHELFITVNVICISIAFILLLMFANRNTAKLFFFTLSFFIYITFICHVSMILFFRLNEILLYILTFISLLIFVKFCRDFFIKYSILNFLILITSFNSLCVFSNMIS